MQPYQMNYGYGYNNPYQFNTGMNNSYMQRLQMLEQQTQPYMNTMQQQQPFGQVMQQASGLQGKIVDGLDVVKATDVDMTGAVTYYPQSDGQAIYTKQLQPDGRSRIDTYVRIENNKKATENNINVENLMNNFEAMRLDLTNQIAELKAIIAPPAKSNVNISKSKEETK